MEKGVLDQINEGFTLAPEYEYVGIAYFMDEEGNPRDGYIPMGTDTVFTESDVYAKNHGVSCKVQLTREYENAQELLNDCINGDIQLSGDDIQDILFREGGNVAEDKTMGIRYYCVAGNDSAGNPNAYMKFFYADIKDDGYYLLAEFIFYGPEFDEDTAALITELSDAYGVNFPQTQEDMKMLAELGQ